MSLPELIILDVGHGNCSILRNTEGVCIIDTATAGDTLVNALKENQITDVSNVFISHADSDHIGGLVELLLEPSLRIQNVFINSDATKDTEMWLDVRKAIRTARNRSDIKVYVGLTTDTKIPHTGEAKIEVISPTPEMALGGAGGRDLAKRRLTSNSLSVVIRIVHRQHPVALLAADMDNTTLEGFLEERKNLKADVLIFPHHGGKPGKANAGEFTGKLCQMVRPKLVVFSIGRSKYKMPHPEVVSSVRKALPEAHMLCTQLSVHCASELPQIESKHLSGIPAKGWANPWKVQCCGGSIAIRMIGENTKLKTVINPHKGFIQRHVPNRICR